MSSINIKTDVIKIRACRVCLDSQCSKYVLLTQGNGWIQLYEYCFNVTLKHEDQPRLVCFDCADRMQNFYTFKSKCQSSEELWKYLTILKCRVLLKPIKVAHQTTIKNESNNSIETFDNDFSYFNDSNSNNSACIDIKNETYNTTSTGIVNFEARETDMSYKNENTDFTCENKNVSSDKSIDTKRKFTCNWCLKTYNVNKWYMRHLSLCKENEQFINGHQTTTEYPYCISDLSKHSKKNENQLNIDHLCGICKYSSKEIGDVNKHLNDHWENNDLRCMICEFVAKDRAGIAAHRYAHLESSSVRYLCHICQKKTKSQLTLQFHYRKEHLNKPGGLCSQPECDKVYNCWRLWKKHEKIHLHPGYICDICGQKYKYRHLIAAHLINHTSPPTHVCDVCGKIFRRMRNLKVHIQNVHVVADPIKCTHCERVFKNQFHLGVHQKRLAMEKTLKCEFCPMEYSMLSQLNSHLKSHSEERPHCCHICGSRYKAKSQLVIHMRNHTGDRPYKCLLCVKAFTSGNQLKAHTMIHTGVLPFKCQHCEKSFRSKKRLLGHCAVQHAARANQ